MHVCVCLAGNSEHFNPPASNEYRNPPLPGRLSSNMYVNRCGYSEAANCLSSSMNCKSGILYLFRRRFLECVLCVLIADSSGRDLVIDLEVHDGLLQFGRILAVGILIEVTQVDEALLETCGGVFGIDFADLDGPGMLEDGRFGGDRELARVDGFGNFQFNDF